MEEETKKEVIENLDLEEELNKWDRDSFTAVLKAAPETSKIYSRLTEESYKDYSEPQSISEEKPEAAKPVAEEEFNEEFNNTEFESEFNEEFNNTEYKSDFNENKEKEPEAAEEVRPESKQSVESEKNADSEKPEEEQEAAKEEKPTADAPVAEEEDEPEAEVSEKDSPKKGILFRQT